MVPRDGVCVCVLALSVPVPDAGKCWYALGSEAPHTQGGVQGIAGSEAVESRVELYVYVPSGTD